MTRTRHVDRRAGLLTRIAAAMLVVFVAGCTAAATPKPAATTAATAAATAAASAGPTADTTPRGGSMTIINGSDIKSWDPAITSGTFPGGPMDALDAIYGFLLDNKELVKLACQRLAATTLPGENEVVPQLPICQTKK